MGRWVLFIQCGNLLLLFCQKSVIKLHLEGYIKRGGFKGIVMVNYFSLYSP